MMSGFLKNTDDSFLSDMMRQQTGMNMSSEQIKMMKSMMTPDLLKNSLNQPGFENMAAQMGATNNTQPTATTTSPQPGISGNGQPNLSNLMNNSDFMSNMMGSLTKNPDMLKNMAGMLGKDNPLGKFMENKSPEELERMMKSMQGIMGVFSKVSPVLMFFKKYWKHMVALLVCYIVYCYL